jgi:large subunit ribosomal protein L24
MPAHVRKGDTVMITSGSHKGKTGEIVRVNPDDQTVIVKGINLRTKHMKPTRINPQGGIITKEAPLHWSKVSPVVDGRPSRVRFQSRDDGSKVRVAVVGGKVLGTVRGPRRDSGAAPAPKKSTSRKSEKAGAGA